MEAVFFYPNVLIFSPLVFFNNLSKWLIYLDLGAFEPRSSLGKINTDFILGICKQNGRSFIILDIDSMLSDGELALIRFLAKITASVA